MKALAASLALALAGCASVPVSPVYPVAAWRPVDAQTGSIVEPAALEQLAQDIPDSSSVRLRLLNAQLGAQDFDGAVANLRWLQLRGYVFSDRAKARIGTLFGPEREGAVKPLLLDAPKPVVGTTLHAIVPAGAGLVESVLMDLRGGRMAVTSVSGRSVWATAPDGTLQEVAPEDAGNLSGIVFDPVRNAIWAASGQIDGAPASGFAGLIEIVPGSGQGRRIPAPGGVSLSDLHRAADGAIYASAPTEGGVYRLRPDAQSIEQLVPAGTFRSPQGLATGADGRRLYVSDYRYGIGIVDLATGSVSRLSTRLPLMLDGVDGLWRQGNELIAVQNGLSPMRIMAFALSQDGLSVVGQRTLEIGHPEWTEPLSGYLGGGALYYVANGQWDRWVDGKPVEGKPFTQTYIFRLPTEP